MKYILVSGFPRNPDGAGEKFTLLKFVRACFSHNVIVQLFLLAVVTTQLAAQTTYYIDAIGGNDGSNGITPATAWKSLTKINATVFAPGDSILLKSGSAWTGQLKPKGSGNAMKAITIDTYGGTTKPLIIGGGVTGEAAVYLNNQQYWEINNLEITNDAATAGDRRGMLIAASNFGLVHHIYLRNLNIHNVKGIVDQTDAAKRTAGIGIETSNDASTPTRYDDILIEGCTISSIENTGLYTDNLNVRNDYPHTAGWLARRFTNVRIRNNIIHDISKNAMIIRLFDHGVIEHNVCYETAQQTTGNTIYSISSDSTIFQYNEGYLNRSPAADGSLYDADLRSPNTVWQYSYSHDNAHGLFWTCTVQEDSGVVCRYNISQNDKGNIFCVNYPNTSVYCYNNTVYCGPAVSPKIISERNVNAGTRKYYFYNNIIFNNSSGATYDFRTSGYTRIIDFNLFYGLHPLNEPADAHKLTTNPLLVSAGSGGLGITSVDGYRLQAGSPAINSGYAVHNHSSTDYWGNSVPTGPAVDRGAYESSDAPRYTLTVNASNGSVTRVPNQSEYDSNSTVQLTAVPATGFHFLHWTGDLSGSLNPASIVMNSNKTVVANFEPNTSSTYKMWIGGAGDGLWSSSANWSTGAVPTSSDTVVLDHSTVLSEYTVSVTTSGSTCRNLIVGSATTLTIDGSSSTLTVGDALTGNFDIVIHDGGEIKNLSTASSGTPFALMNSANDRFRIENGGKYFHNSPRGFSTPFPASACSFDVQSTFEYAQASPVNPPMAARTYGNLILSSTLRKSLSATISSGLTINGTFMLLGDSLSFTANWSTGNVAISALNNSGDTLSFSSSSSPIVIGTIMNNGLITNTTATSTVTVTGDVVNNGRIILGSNSSFQFHGSQVQSISGTGSEFSGANVKFDNAAGIVSQLDVLISSGILTLSAGTITMSNGKRLKLASGVTTQRLSGHVVGYLEKSVASGGTVVTFEIGDASAYTPVTMSFDNVTTPGTVGIMTVAGDHPNIISSGIDPTRSLNRYYRLTAPGIVFDSCNVLLRFAPSDVDAGATTGKFIVQRYDATQWSSLKVGVCTDSSAQILAMNELSDIAVGESAQLSFHAISASAGPHGSILPSGTVFIVRGLDTMFTFIPDLNYSVDSVFVNGNFVGSPSNYQFRNVRADSTIHVTFAWSSPPLFQLSASSVHGSVAKVPDQMAYDSGAIVQLTAIADPNYLFCGWSGDTTSSQNPISIAMDKDKSIVANFLNLTAKIPVFAGWNIISLPRAGAESRKDILFPDAASKAFSYKGTYVTAESLFHGVGYWLKFAAPETLTMSGTGRFTDSIAVRSGWNMIGALSYPIPTASLISDPPGLVTSQFYAYDRIYVTSDTILPGKGYWVRVNQSGTLFLQAFGAADVQTEDPSLSARIRIVPTTETPAPPPQDKTASLGVPVNYVLQQNFPNPFNPSTTVRYSLPSASYVTLKVYDVLGREIATLVDGHQPAGEKSSEWDARGLTSGVYFYRLTAGSFMSIKEMLFVR